MDTRSQDFERERREHDREERKRRLGRRVWRILVRLGLVSER